jgi:hypothetical protein
MDIDQNVVDDSGTGQGDAQDMLRAFCENGFDGDDQQAGLVLGRPASEIREMIDGDLEIDDDLAMKARGIAQERGISLD